MNNAGAPNQETTPQAEGSLSLEQTNAAKTADINCQNESSKKEKKLKQIDTKHEELAKKIKESKQRKRIDTTVLEFEQCIAEKPLDTLDFKHALELLIQALQQMYESGMQRTLGSSKEVPLKELENLLNNLLSPSISEQLNNLLAKLQKFEGDLIVLRAVVQEYHVFQRKWKIFESSIGKTNLQGEEMQAKIKVMTEVTSSLKEFSDDKLLRLKKSLEKCNLEMEFITTVPQLISNLQFFESTKKALSAICQEKLIVIATSQQQEISMSSSASQKTEFQIAENPSMTYISATNINIHSRENDTATN